MRILIIIALLVLSGCAKDWTDTEAQIQTYTEKTSPVSADTVVIADSEAANATKKVQIGNLPGAAGVKEIYVEDPEAEDFEEVVIFTQASTVTGISCITDTGTATLNFENGANDVATSDIVCDTDGQTGTVNTSYDNFTANSYGDLSITSVASTPGKVSVFITYTVD